MFKGTVPPRRLHAAFMEEIAAFIRAHRDEAIHRLLAVGFLDPFDVRLPAKTALSFVDYLES